MYVLVDFVDFNFFLDGLLCEIFVFLYGFLLFFQLLFQELDTIFHYAHIGLDFFVLYPLVLDRNLWV